MPRVDINGTVVDFPESLSPDDLNKAVASAAQQLGNGGKTPLSDVPGNALKEIKQQGEGLAGMAVAMAKDPFSPITAPLKIGAESLIDMARGWNFRDTPAYKVPMSMVDGLLERGKKYLGRGLSGPWETFKETPLTTISELGGLASSVVGGLSSLPEAASGLEDVAQTRGAKALGYTKRLLNTPEKLASSKIVAQEMLDRGVIKPFASGEDMAGSVQDVINKSGSDIGSFLKTRGTGFDTQSAVQALNEVRPKAANGQWLTGGAYDKINSAIDSAIDTVRAHGEIIPFEEANKLKGFLQDLVNWNSTKAEAATGKGIAGAMRKAVDTSLESASGSGPEFDQFMKDKETYGAAQEAQDALANRLSSEHGNKSISLTDTIVGAGELAAGNPVGAAAAVGGKMFIERYWNQGISSAADHLAKTLKSNPEVFGKYTPMLKNAAMKSPKELALVARTLQGNDPVFRGLLESLPKAAGEPKGHEDMTKNPDTPFPFLPKWNEAAAEPTPSPIPTRPSHPLTADMLIYRDGLDHFIMGDIPSAVTAWKKALHVNPNNKWAEAGLKRLEEPTE